MVQRAGFSFEKFIGDRKDFTDKALTKYRTRVKDAEKDLKTADSKIPAWNGLLGQSEALRGKLQLLYSQAMGNSVFNQKGAIVLGDDKCVTATTTKEASIGDINIEVTHVATASVCTSPIYLSTFTMPDDFTMQVTLPDATVVDVDLSDGDNISTIRTKLTSALSGNGVEVGIVNTDATHCVFILKSSKTGAGTINVANDVNNDAFVSIAGQNAIVNVNNGGATITSASNRIEVAPGVNIDVRNITQAGVATSIRVEPDRKGISQAILSAVDDINAMLKTIAQQTEMQNTKDKVAGTEEKIERFKDTAPLGGDTTFNNIRMQLYSMLGIIPGYSGQHISPFDSLGLEARMIPATKDNPSMFQIIFASESKFQNAINGELQAVQDFFQTGMEITPAAVGQQSAVELVMLDSTFNSTWLSKNIQVRITSDADAVTRVEYSLDDGATWLNDANITNLNNITFVGTALAGLHLAAKPSPVDGSEIFTVRVRRGFADKMSEFVDSSNELIRNSIIGDEKAITRHAEELERAEKEFKQKEEKIQETLGTLMNLEVQMELMMEFFDGM